MSDELRAARERLRRYHADKDARVGPDHPYGFNYWAGGWYFNTERWRRDVNLLAENDLAEHPADDDERTDIEWLSTIPGVDARLSKHFNNICWVCADVYDRIDLKFVFQDDGSYEIMLEEWSIYKGPAQTRRDVRRLLAAMGIEVAK